jgi:hypothetical protein
VQLLWGDLFDAQWSVLEEHFIMENKYEGCRRRLQQIISVLVFSFNMVVFYTCIINHLPNPNTRVTLTILFSVCSFVLFLCTATTYLLPTTPPKDSEATACPGFCRLCNLPMPPLTKHCRTCNKCTMGFDHHCNWIDKCIGVRNYRWFVGMVAMAFGQGLLGAVAAIWALSGVEEYGWAVQAILGVIVDVVVIAVMVYVGVKQMQRCWGRDRNIMGAVHPEKKSTLDT